MAFFIGPYDTAPNAWLQPEKASLYVEGYADRQEGTGGQPEPVNGVSQVVGTIRSLICLIHDMQTIPMRVMDRCYLAGFFDDSGKPVEVDAGADYCDCVSGSNHKGKVDMKLRKEELPIALEMPVATFRRAEWDDMAVAYVKLMAGADAAPLLKGLPDDKCQCPHWGYILTGAVHVRYNNGEEEVCQAGQMFHWPAGHTVWVETDTSFVEFSPKKQLKAVYDHIGNKLASVS